VDAALWISGLGRREVDRQPVAPQQEVIKRTLYNPQHFVDTVMMSCVDNDYSLVAVVAVVDC